MLERFAGGDALVFRRSDWLVEMAPIHWRIFARFAGSVWTRSERDRILEEGHSALPNAKDLLTLILTPILWQKACIFIFNLVRIDQFDLSLEKASQLCVSDKWRDESIPTSTMDLALNMLR